MNEHELRRRFPNASESVLRANRSTLAANALDPELFSERSENKADAPDAVRGQLEQRDATGALRKEGAKREDSKRFLVRVTSVRSRLIDEDNLCEKYIVDCCRYSGLLPGDGPGQTKIEAKQRQAGKGEEEHTVIEIYEL